MPQRRKSPGTKVVPTIVPPRIVFVIMPFTSTPSRSESDLTEFFQTNLRLPVEQNRGELAFRYSVRRSDDSFNITERIIHDLYDADVVICDLSGINANPNVMYELGVRLAITNKPVILIRESSPETRESLISKAFMPTSTARLVTARCRRIYLTSCANLKLVRKRMSRQS